MSLFQPLSGMLPAEILSRLDAVVGGILGDTYNAPVATLGTVPAARLVFITDATDADTITIGGHTFKFLTTLVAANTFTQVKRGTSAAATRASLVNAINGVADATVVQATTPFDKSIVADVVSTSVRIRLADARGGAAIPGVSPSIALAESLTPAASIWNCANLNVAGKTAASGSLGDRDQLTVTAQMITATTYNIEFSFTPTGFSATVRTSTGACRAYTDTIAISGNSLLITFGGGAAPNMQAGDIIAFEAWA